MTATALLRACPQRNGCPLVSPRDLRRLDLAPRVKTLALAAGASVLLHLGAMAALAPREAALIAGGGEDAPAALGTSFADFAEGVLSPSEAEPLDMEQAATTPPVPPAQALTPHPPQPEQAALVAPMAPDQSAALLPAMPESPETSSPPERAPRTASEPTARTAPPEIIAAAPSQTISPDTSPSELAPATSRTPPARPDRAAPPQPTRQARAPQGNAAQTAARGSQQGSDGQSTSQAPARAQASAQGNAAASNYPGEVLRRIQRTRQARSPARGQVLVVFTVGNNGNLASASVARTSGHSGLDQAALDHIRRAAPFPPPPTGAQRQFSFEFVGR
ncbi:TonB family protein [Roseinatronobacter bogoriensis]|uniref:Energy transducer TonB n=1 Tax=Roseinatronobacter bogoriensis subsp. barguzinensis TaxID=441209 RepID=A0A2K8KD33_9RHOB|nr:MULTISPECIES: TonB family protein [Rhodobaca]ATX65615.1 energy transducer TonB [Rhodobaca barguzinensis]MBB4208449.1 protein TonB [Rhodobaca bogoriensis DSM 18756]TDW39091.1 outer membrane transport energization protein TonB [Rhodobaca barguzinensis]TDY66410.1 outer membrane transport energization protein TonB [Rhodobaca bogoriensis DSM 18756]